MNNDMTVSLANATVLVNLTITAWSANKRDKKASKTVADDHGVANASTARLYKSLLPNSDTHAHISRLVSKVREEVRFITLPWSDGGERILNINLMHKFMDLMTDYEQEFNTAVDSLCAELANEIVKASFTMGTLFDQDDYPTENEVRRKHSFAYAITPLPTTQDFRVDLPADMAERVKESYKNAATSRTDAALGTAWSRVHDKVSQLVLRLTDLDDGSRKRFGNDLIESAQELVDTLRHLNITNDFELEQCRVALQDTLSGINTAQIKSSGGLRLQVTEDLREIQDKFNALSL